MDSVVLQLCYDGWWETLVDGRTEYVNAKNTSFFHFQRHGTLAEAIDCAQSRH